MNIFENYCNKWVKSLSIEMGEKIILTDSDRFKSGDIVKFTFNDTIAQIKGFHICPVMNNVCAIIGDNQSMFIDNLVLATEKQITVFKTFSDINGNPTLERFEMLMSTQGISPIPKYHL